MYLGSIIPFKNILSFKGCVRKNWKPRFWHWARNRSTCQEMLKNEWAHNWAFLNHYWAFNEFHCKRRLHRPIIQISTSFHLQIQIFKNLRQSSNQIQRNWKTNKTSQRIEYLCGDFKRIETLTMLMFLSDLQLLLTPCVNGLKKGKKKKKCCGMWSLFCLFISTYTPSRLHLHKVNLLQLQVLRNFAFLSSLKKIKIKPALLIF